MEGNTKVLYEVVTLEQRTSSYIITEEAEVAVLCSKCYHPTQNECTSTELLEITQILTANKLLYKANGQLTNVGRASLSSPRVTLVRNLIHKALLSLNQPPNICATLLSWMKLLKELQFS